MRSLDFSRARPGLIRVNRVLIDVQGVNSRIGVDGFARLLKFPQALDRARSKMEPTDLCP